VVRTPTYPERILAELIGTFLLVFVGGGTAAAAAIALAHAKQTSTSASADLVLVALAHALILFIIVLTIGKVSGAHVNPAITIGLAAIGRFPWTEVIGYLVGQVIGAIAGAAAILIVYGADAAKLGHLGGPSLAVNTNLLQGFLIEGIGTAILVFAVVGTAVDARSPAGWAGLTIGLALGAIIMFLGPASGATVNPARAFGPDLVSVFFGVSVDWVQFIVAYLLGPIVGGIGAAALYAYVAHLPRLKR
jgi:glycerol uptake facilitator